MPDIFLDEIETTTQSALIAQGALPWIAAEVAKAVREAEGYGNRICGLYYLESYCQQLKTGRVRKDADPVVTHPRPGQVEVDAKFGFAQAAFSKALPIALEAARVNGTASLAVAHAHTCTSLGYFTRQIANAGMIAFGATNASPIVAAPGAKTRVIGTNPVAFSVPGAQGNVALHFDQSTTAVALGKITMAKAAGQSIPEGWAVDANGTPTTDPDAALAGSLVSAGGAKGWGFGLMAEILASALTASTPSRDVKPLKAPHGEPHDLGQYYLIIDPSQSDGFADRVTDLARAVSQDDGARMPGQGKTVMDPVCVPDALWDQTYALSQGHVNV